MLLIVAESGIYWFLGFGNGGTIVCIHARSLVIDDYAVRKI